MKGFGSDNHSGVHPLILKAIIDANLNHAPSYGTDSWTERALQIMKRHFGEECEAYFVFNGTAANVLALSACVESHHAILTSEHSHLVNDECGAPEKNLGAKLIPVMSKDGKLTVSVLKPHLVRRGDQHRSQPRALSITQPTELGALYTPAEIVELSRFARSEGLLLHMDGARLVNAAAALGLELGDLTTDCGVDVLSLGGTKNGLIFGEAVVFLERDLAKKSRDFRFKRKQLMQLPSKTRFISAQFNEFLGTDLWRENALHANMMARRLHDGLKVFDSVEIARPAQVNSVFARFPKAWVSTLKETAFFYVWDELSFECRLMTTWDTRDEEIDRFLTEVARLHNQTRR